MNCPKTPPKTMSGETSKPKLFYFNIRGRAEPVRLLLHDVGVEYVEEHPADWRAVKPGLYESGTAPFGQLPIFYTGDDSIPAIVQMNSILRYLGRKYNLYGTSAAETTKIDMIMDGAEDLRIAYTMVIYMQDCSAEAVTGLAERIKTPLTRGGGQVDQFERILGRSTGSYLVGNTPTIADYVLFDLFSDILKIVPDALAAAPKLTAWMELMGNRPNIKAYIESNPPHRVNVNGNGKGN